MKHLVQMQQLTATKAFALVETYPTVGRLMSALASAGTDAEDDRQRMMAGGKLLGQIAVQGRGFGDQLGIKLSHLYSEKILN